MQSPTIDAFTVNGRTTVRSDDGGFLRLGPDTAIGEGLDPALTERVRTELAARRRARRIPPAGRQDIGTLLPAGLPESLQALLPAATLRQVTRGDAEHCGLVLQFARTAAERSALDHLPASGTAVLRCYREGGILYIDPLAAKAEDPGGSQVLRRRLAASPASAELEQWLHTGAADADSLQGLPGGAVQVFLARLATTIAAWQHDSPACNLLRRTLWRLDTATLLASEHPVLAYPEPAPLPETARPR